MFIDASALTAILLNEDDAPELLARMQNYDIRITSPLAVWETASAVARGLSLDLKASEATVQAFLTLARITVTPVPSAAHSLAIEAFDRFGKGRHPAALNFGDCFAYACARLADAPLLYKGNDFPQTDILPA
jgi:ribonuclease VapC